jgi:hypothetical protein
MERILRWKEHLPPNPIVISLLILILLVGVIGYLMWPTSLEPWEEAAIHFWSVGSVHEDTKQLEKLITSDSLLKPSEFKQGEPDQPGTVWVGSFPGKTPNEKTVYVLFDQVPPTKANLRITYMKKENGKWLVDITGGEQVPAGFIEQFKSEAEKQGVKWKKVELK